MDMITLAIMMAVTVEGTVEICKSIVRAFVSSDIKTAVTQVTALVISVALCLAAGADAYAALGVEFHIPFLGMILTGILASRGSNYISDFVKQLQGLAHK